MLGSVRKPKTTCNDSKHLEEVSAGLARMSSALLSKWGPEQEGILGQGTWLSEQGMLRSGGGTTGTHGLPVRASGDQQV